MEPKCLSSVSHNTQQERLPGEDSMVCVCGVPGCPHLPPCPLQQLQQRHSNGSRVCCLEKECQAGCEHRWHHPVLLKSHLRCPLSTHDILAQLSFFGSWRSIRGIHPTDFCSADDFRPWNLIAILYPGLGTAASLHFIYFAGPFSCYLSSHPLANHSVYSPWNSKAHFLLRIPKKQRYSQLKRELNLLAARSFCWVNNLVIFYSSYFSFSPFTILYNFFNNN